MTAVSKNVYIDRLDDIVNEYNITHHRTFKMKPTDVKGNTCIDSIKEVNFISFISFSFYFILENYTKL